MYNNTTRPKRRNSGPAGRNNPQRRNGGGGYKGGNRGGNKKRRGQYINPERFIQAAKPLVEIKYEPENSFEDFELHPNIKRNLRERNYLAPTKIQDKAIPDALKNKDIIGIANTGMGKTAAFSLPMIHKLMTNRGQRALIVAPTRELALQIQQETRSFAKGCKLFDTLLIGGVNIGPQLRDLKRKPEIIIGTPGRIKDHIERGTLDLSDVKTAVLDEVDRMLDMGFINDIRSILSELPEERQSMYFSATMSPTIESLIKTFTHSPVSIMARTSETSEHVEQSVMHYKESHDKMEKLHELLILEGVDKILIFCETKRGVERLSKDLYGRGFKSDAIHGNKSQGQRQRALKKFRDDHIKVLVATDVAARGIDVTGVSHVINYDIPQTYDDYTHRIGRTGRGGKTGNAVTFVTH